MTDPSGATGLRLRRIQPDASGRIQARALLVAVALLAACTGADSDSAQADADTDADTGGGTGTGGEPDVPPDGLPQTFEEACAMVPGCQESPYDLGGPRETISVVDLRLDEDGALAISDVDNVDVLSAIGKPTEALGGTHTIVAEDANGNWLEVHALSFPTTMIFEDPEAFVARDVTLSEGDARTSVYFSETGIDNVVVYDNEAVEVARAPFIVDRSFRAAVASPACSHVVLIEGPGDSDFIPLQTLDSQNVLASPADPGPLQRAVVQAALNRMAPTLCHGLHRIGFIEAPNALLGGYVAPAVSGDLILINTKKYSEQQLFDNRALQLQLMTTLHHEAGHATENLLQWEGEPLYTIINYLLLQHPVVGGWTFESEAVAGELVQSARLLKGIRQEWGRMHGDFMSEGFGAEPYAGVPMEVGECGGAIQFYDALQTAEAGFMTRYGGTARHDDVADMVAWSSMAPMFRAEGISSIYNPEDPEGCGGRTADVEIPEDSACRAFRDWDGDGIPLNLAAAYTKLRMVYELGMITQEAFDECVGDVSLDIPGPGFHVYEGGDFQRSFDQAVAASIGTDTGTGEYKFVMNAEGRAGFGDSEYDAEITLELVVGPSDVEIDQVSWPRGGYRLTSVDEDSFRVHLPDAPAGSFEVSEGFVLVTASNKERIEGSVVVQEAWRWLAPIPVPEVYDPPLVFRFLIEN